MDGWESRRKRTPGHDWAIIQLATSGKITGFDIDTNFFLGNHPPHASIEAINLPNADGIKDWENLAWKEILPKSHLDAGSQNFYDWRTGEPVEFLDDVFGPLKESSFSEPSEEMLREFTRLDIQLAIDEKRWAECPRVHGPEHENDYGCPDCGWGVEDK